ncbi:MAG: 3-deoxy-D-manno-octulosonic acid transferase [Candidatus Hydrogenedentota bacterium]
MSAAAPLGAAYLALHPKYKPLLGRFHPRLPEGARMERPLLLHACSVGEVNVAATLHAAIARRWPGIPVAVTVSTVTGRALAHQKLPSVPVLWFPFDHSRVVRRFFREINPRAVFLLETELWPNAIATADRHRIPVAVLNGRISDRAYPRYRRYKGWIRPVVEHIQLVCAQTEEHAGRFRELGVCSDSVGVTGNMKFDGVRTAYTPGEMAAIRASFGFAADDLVLVYGSLRAGDEHTAVALWRAVRDSHPRIRFVVAPRHPEFVDTVANAFGEPVARRTQPAEDSHSGSSRVLVLDTVGELAGLYSVASVAVVGGSFHPGVNGHNPIESAALGVPTLFGPYMRNFADSADALLRAGGAVQTPAEALEAEVLRLIAHPDRASRLAANGKAAIASAQGAVERTLRAVEESMPAVFRE